MTVIELTFEDIEYMDEMYKVMHMLGFDADAIDHFMRAWSK